MPFGKSIYSSAIAKHHGDGWPAGVTMFDPSPRGGLEHGATPVRVDVGADPCSRLSAPSHVAILTGVIFDLGTHVGIAIPKAEPSVMATGAYKALDKDGLTEIGERHRGMSVRHQALISHQISTNTVVL